MLTSLSSVDVEEAQQSIHALTGLVHDVLASNQDICRRLEQADHSLKHRSAPSALETGDHTDGDDTDSVSGRDTWCSDTTLVAKRAAERDSSFERDLHQSRVYTRISRNMERRSDPDAFSLPSSRSRSMGYSFLSGLSLADVSDVSLISLRIPIQSLSNSQRYQGSVATHLPSRYCLQSSDHVAPSGGKILLLGELLHRSHAHLGLNLCAGISNAGKSTIFKNLQLMQGIEPTPVEVEEARRVILTGLIDTFRHRLLRSLRVGFIGDFHAVLHVLTYVSTF